MYRGIHLGTRTHGVLDSESPMPGEPWQSQCPIILGRLSEVTDPKRKDFIQGCLCDVPPQYGDMMKAAVANEIVSHYHTREATIIGYTATPTQLDGDC
jgi:hypothetical protein